MKGLEHCSVHVRGQRSEVHEARAPVGASTARTAGEGLYPWGPLLQHAAITRLGCWVPCGLCEASPHGAGLCCRVFCWRLGNLVPGQVNLGPAYADTMGAPVTSLMDKKTNLPQFTCPARSLAPQLHVPVGNAFPLDLWPLPLGCNALQRASGPHHPIRATALSAGLELAPGA